MNIHHPNHPAHRYEPTREDILIGRVVDGEASPSDWGELEHLARGDTGLWQRLAQSQRAHARLERAVEDRIAVAELIELPEPPGVLASFRARWQSWSGWAAAAAVAIAWLGAGRGPAMNAPTGPASQGAAIAGLSLDDALQQYIERGRRDGRVLREMPAQYVDSRDLGQGKGREVIFVRQILERMPVTDVHVARVVKDEHGEERIVPESRPLPADMLGASRRTY